MIYYKFLNQADSGGYSAWSWGEYLPRTDGQPANWTPAVRGELIMCLNGYHLCYWDTLLSQYELGFLYAAEVGGKILEDSSHPEKITTRRVRLLRQVNKWNEKELLLWVLRRAKQAVSMAMSLPESPAKVRDLFKQYERYFVEIDQRLEVGGVRAAKMVRFPFWLPPEWDRRSMTRGEQVIRALYGLASILELDYFKWYVTPRQFMRPATSLLYYTHDFTGWNVPAIPQATDEIIKPYYEAEYFSLLEMLGEPRQGEHVRLIDDLPF
ncbi:MAG: hypothetical protein M0R06_06300 [Sphaerochaeta sp.]|jgi:hypothetical protein|nr:hypothetical protein [Sphaerochaeta sp.]